MVFIAGTDMYEIFLFAANIQFKMKFRLRLSLRLREFIITPIQNRKPL